MGGINLSPHKLNLFSECPRCFFLAEKGIILNDKGFKKIQEIQQKFNTKSIIKIEENRVKITRPAGIFSSLPSGLDSIIKNYFDAYRKYNELPPEVKNQIKGKLVDEETIKLMRNWQKFFFEEKINNTKIKFYGGLDECIVNNGLYYPLDFKTRGFALRQDTSEIYQLSLDCYALLLEKKGYKPGKSAYLIYYIPNELLGTNVKFDVQIEERKTNIKNAYKTLEEAVKLLSQDSLPESKPECDFCKYSEISKILSQILR